MTSPTPELLLRQHFGYDRFRPSQAAVIDHVLSGRHAMVVMPTGMGKSLCYQIPALVPPQGDGSIVLVLSPLIALMQDQVDALVRRGIDATFINSSLDPQTRRDRYQALASGHYRILFVTPERFRKSEFCDAIAHRSVKLLAIDEAHCVSQWGHDFRPDYSRIADIRCQLGQPTTIALTATATAQCRRDLYRQIGIDSADIKLFHEGIDRPNLDLDVIPVYDEEEKLRLLIDLIRERKENSGSCIVYFSLIKTLTRFSDHLRSLRFDHLCYHGDLPRHFRREIQDRFIHGKDRLVLATNAFGMGIDKEDIRLVVHAETPGSIESYYQEIGRAGRDGLASRCVWLYAQQDLLTQMQFIEWANPDAAYYIRLYQLLAEHGEQCRAFGLDWINGRLQRQSKQDHRIETAIAMFDRHGVVAGPRPPLCYEVRSPLPIQFQDDGQLIAKKRRDQQRLYALVQLAATEADDRKRFLNQYFADTDGSPSAST